MMWTDLIPFVLLLIVFLVYRNVINTIEWNNGKCPHCNGGFWQRYGEKGYRCSSCKRFLYKL